MSDTPRTDSEIDHAHNLALELNCRPKSNPPTDDDWYVVPATFSRQLERELAEALEWKRQMLLVESEWDEQEIGKILGMTLGTSIRRNLLPEIQKLKAENKRSQEALKKYGGHLLDCQEYHSEMNAKPRVCDCGFEDAKKI